MDIRCEQWSPAGCWHLRRQFRGNIASLPHRNGRPDLTAVYRSGVPIKFTPRFFSAFGHPASSGGLTELKTRAPSNTARTFVRPVANSPDARQRINGGRAVKTP